MTFQTPPKYYITLLDKFGIPLEQLIAFAYGRTVRDHEVLQGIFHFLWGHAPGVFSLLYEFYRWAPRKHLCSMVDSFDVFYHGGQLNPCYIISPGKDPHWETSSMIRIRLDNSTMEIYANDRFLRGGPPYPPSFYCNRGKRKKREDTLGLVHQTLFDEESTGPFAIPPVLWCYILMCYLKKYPQI